MSVDSKMTAIADEIRVLSGTTDLMGLDLMASHIGDANDNIDIESDLILQITDALNNKVGGTSLNFEVVSNPQPSNPKENTIWINTNVDINRWIFAAKQPYQSEQEIYTEVGITSGYYINNEGKITASSNYVLTDYISLPDGTNSITMTASESTASTVSHWFYDASGEAISYELRANGTATYAVPTGAKSVRVSIRSDDTKSIIARSDVAIDGDVWIPTGISSTIEFNALTENGIQIYPLHVKQHIGGAWVDKTAKIWQNGKWVDWWNGELYDAGNEFEFVTGGWSADGWTVTGVSVTGITTVDGTKGEDYLQIQYSSNKKCYMFGTQNKIDFTGYKTLEVECEKVSGAEMYVVTPKEKYVVVTQTTPSVTMSKSGVATLDISTVGSAYIALVPRLNGSEIPKWKITKVRLLK